MKKKTYQQPEMKVGKLEQTDIICTSQFTTKQGDRQQNEEYEEVNETVTRGWFN